MYKEDLKDMLIGAVINATIVLTGIFIYFNFLYKNISL